MKHSPASNSQVKKWKKLLMGKYRTKHQLFLAEGQRCVEQIIKGDRIKIEAVVLEEGFEPEWQIDHTRYNFFKVSKADFQAISDTDNPQGVLAVCRIPEETDFSELNKKNGVIVALDGIQDPGNAGTIIRTAAWFNAAGIVFGTGTVDPFHPKVVRSTAGATGTLPFMKGSLEELLNRFEQNERMCYLMEGSDKAIDIREIQPGTSSVLVIGNEGNGISEKLFTPYRTSVRIPGNNQATESLNAAIALAIGLYQFSPSFSRYN